MRTIFACPDLLDFLRKLLKKKKNLKNGKVWTVDAIALNFLKKLDSIDGSMWVLGR